MSEYQRYEWMTIDRPLTAKELDEVDDLSSHIEATPTHALIEYHWGDFKHEPVDVLYRYFDGFLYWANWGSPQLAFRFPHGVLQADLFNGYDLEDFVTFTRHADFDILNIEFGEMEAPDEWVDYELGSLIPIRDELMEGDLRALYIVWLASQRAMEGYDEDYDGEEEKEEEEYEIDTPPVPAGFSELTAAQYSLAELLQVPQELLNAAARHSRGAGPSRKDDFTAWVRLLTPDRQHDYLVRLAHNEPGLSRKLLRELRELSQDKSGAVPPEGERVPYETLLAESKGIRARLEDERREQERAARLRHLQEIYDQQDTSWRQIEQATARPAGARYDEAIRLLVDLRDAAEQFGETRQFQERYRAWVQPLLRRPALVERLRAKGFVLPEA